MKLHLRVNRIERILEDMGVDLESFNEEILNESADNVEGDNDGEELGSSEESVERIKKTTKSNKSKSKG